MSTMGRRSKGPLSVRDDQRPAKRYSVEQANCALVLVRVIVRDIVSYYRQVLDCQEVLEACQARGSREQLEQAQKDAMHRVERLQACAEELEQMGVELKDWSAGLVDFPAIVEGREVRLCWQHGEDRIRFWHDSGDDCGDRMDLSKLLAGAERA